MLCRELDDTPHHPIISDTLPPGMVLGRYEILRLIGRGGMGSVYEAVHRDLKKRVAIKTLLPGLAANADARARFLREGESASRIRHPHVVDITDVGVEGTTSYLVMEFLEGEDLAKLIARQGQLSLRQTADIMLPVVAAISAAHDMGVIHRDLKPENIFLSRSRIGGLHPKVLDFGISKVTGDRSTMILTGTGATFGTTFYLPPEQLQGARQADAKSDQYALGTILYECVTGRRAFEGEVVYGVMKDIAEGRYLAPRAVRPDLPQEVEAIITRAMSLNPADRFASVKDLGAAFLGYASPNVRAVWEPFFAQALPDDGFEAPQPVTGGTMFLSKGAAADSGPGRTPSERSARASVSLPALSTLSHANGESHGAIDSGARSLRPSRAPWLIALGAVALGGAVFGVMRLSGGSSNPGAEGGEARDGKDSLLGGRHDTRPAPPRTFRVEIETDPRAATIELDARPVGKGALDERLPVDGTEHVIVARAPNYKEAIVRFTDQPPQHLIALDPIPSNQSPPPPTTASGPADALTDRRSSTPGRTHRTMVKDKARGHNGSVSPRTGSSGPSPNGAPIID
jgi:serine/threonine-protein kinase